MTTVHAHIRRNDHDALSTSVCCPDEIDCDDNTHQGLE